MASTMFFMHPGKLNLVNHECIDFDLEKMRKDLESKAYLMPENKTPEETRVWMRAKRLQRRIARMKSEI